MKGEKMMNYRKADQILPDEIIAMIQEYVDGECIYIPRKQQSKKMWGEISGYRKQLDMRNQEIYFKYKNGCGVTELAQLYFLSKESIYSIIATIRNSI
jgi:Mor family transcriptional regulator